MSKKNLDTLVNRWISRKLFVFIIASLLLLFADLKSADWTLIAIAYLSSQTVIDSVTAYVKAKQSNSLTNMISENE
jgi:hypothetical protein